MARRSVTRARNAPIAVLVLAGLAATSAGCASGRSAGPSTPAGERVPVELELVGTAELAGGTRFAGTTVGGLSAIAFDPRRGEYLALSDDRGREGPPRFYTLEIDLPAPGSPGLREGRVRLLDVVELAPADFVPGAVDPEGLALAGDDSGDDLWIASEGVADDGVAPFVRRFDRRGSQLAELPLPAALTPGDGRGVRDNLGPESLTLTPDGSRLVVATEAALLHDGPAADLETPSLVRLLVYELGGAAQHRLVAAYPYRVEPVAVRPAEPDGFRVNGLVELLAIDRRRLLALERAWAAGGGYALRLFEIDLAAADDVAAVGSLAGLTGLAADGAGAPAPVGKRLVLDLVAALDAAGVAPDNLEGMTFGPRLADGRRTVVLVADDNFNQPEQRTLFVVLALDGADGGRGRGDGGR